MPYRQLSLGKSSHPAWARDVTEVSSTGEAPLRPQPPREVGSRNQCIRRPATRKLLFPPPLEALDLDETAYEGAGRDGRPQANIVAAYLARLKDIADQRCELAFSAILTDYIASATHSGAPALENCCRAYARTPIVTASRR